MDAADVTVTFKAKDELTKKAKEIFNNLKENAEGIALGTAGVFSAIGTQAASSLVTGMKASYKIMKESVDMAADLEQSVGGVQTIFKDSADIVIENANKAYQTAGTSANEYMEQVASFGARLMQATNNNSEEAAKVADMAFKDMSDNANKFGTDMASIEHAYQGFAKANYTMLDNLKLGYGGTKTEMRRLLADAEKISGVKYDIDNLSDIYNAIHVIQEEIGITGTTEQEAASTITGSINAMKAAVQNFMAGTGSAKTVLDTLFVAAKNVVNKVIDLMPDIMAGITEIINGIATQAPVMIVQLLPSFIQGAAMLMNGIYTGIATLVQELAPQLPTLLQSFIDGVISIINNLASILPTLVPTIVSAIMSIIPVLLDNLPTFIEAGIQLMLALIEGIVASIPTLIGYLPLIIQSLVNGFLELLPVLIGFAPQIIMAIVQGIINGIPILIDNAPQIISGLVKGMITAIPRVVDMGWNIIKNMWNGITNAFTNFKKKIPEIPGKIIQGISNGFASIGGIGKNLLSGLANGISSGVKNAVNAASSAAKSVLNKFKSIFGVHSPSTEFAWVGRMNMEGLDKGIEDMSPEIQKTIDGLFDLSPSMSGAVNNTLSPNIIVNANLNYETDPLGQVVSNIKTFAGGAKNDYNYGMGGM